MLNPDTVPAVRWRNGNGFTRTLIEDPSGFRLSVAELETGTEFSTFEGLDRTFLPLVDVTLIVNGQSRTVPRLTPASFRGEDAVSMRLPAGPGRALNLMAVRGRCTGTVRAMSQRDWQRRSRAATGLFVDLEHVVVEVRVAAERPH